MLKHGQSFAQFTILETLGEGGMGVVYLAEDRKLGRKVALKLLTPEFVAQEERLHRFEREARTAASISHPNVTGIFDIGETQDPGTGETVAYIVMEYVQGEPLNRVLETRTLDLPDALRIAEKIASGLEAAHRLRIVHRDIKPENIILTADGEPKILDFGLAKPLAPPLQPGGDVARTIDQAGATMAWDKNLTQEGRIVGTVNYMSPEQARGAALDTRSDVFSFGILLYRLVSGEAPFPGDTQVSVLAKILEGTHAPVRTRHPGIPAELDAIIDRCLQKDPERRYQDTRDLVGDLRTLRRRVDSGMSQSGLSVELGSMPGPRRRPGWLWPAIAGAVVLVGGLAGISLWRGGGGGSVADAGESHLAILSFENRSGDAGLAWLATGLPEILLTDLAQVGELSLISRDRVHDVLKRASRDPDQAGHGEWMEASRQAGATTVLSGSFYRLSGETIQIDARLEDVSSGTIVFADKVRGENALALVDSLSAMVVRKLNVSARTAAPMGDLMTASPEAYRSYHLGMEKMLIGRGDEARELFGQALAVDSTFALPYMRIGMSHVFEGRGQEGAGYFARALEFREKLPPRDRALLDIYSNVWLTQEFGDAFTKMAAFVDTYPDDKEALCLYGALLIGFQADTTGGYARFEEVLEMDPTYPLALELYADDLARFKQYPRAITMLERLRTAYPDSPTAYQKLGEVYQQMNRPEDALARFEEFRRHFPDRPDVLPGMYTLAIETREFDRARALTAEIPHIRPGDVQWAQVAEQMAANLDAWEGRFGSDLQHLRKAVTYSQAIGDSAMIHNSLQTLGLVFRRLEEPDSALAYLGKADRYAAPFERISYPALVVQIDPDRADEMRPRLRDAINSFKAHVPESLWGVADGVWEAFEAFAARDTLAIAEYYLGQLQRPVNQRGPGVEELAGKFLILTGRHAPAIDQLLEARDTTSGLRYLESTYWLGRAYEGVGEGARAVEAYEEVLRYWGAADRDFEPIRGSRAGLARLAS